MPSRGMPGQVGHDGVVGHDEGIQAMVSTTV